MKFRVVEMEFNDAAKNSHKFYNVYEVFSEEGAFLGTILNWGRIGTWGSVSTLPWHDGAASYRKCQEKSRKGYVTNRDESMVDQSVIPMTIRREASRMEKHYIADRATTMTILELV